MCLLALATEVIKYDKCEWITSHLHSWTSMSNLKKGIRCASMWFLMSMLALVTREYYAAGERA